MESVISSATIAQTSANSVTGIGVRRRDTIGENTFPAEIEVANSRTSETEKKSLGGTGGTSRKKKPSCGGNKPETTGREPNASLAPAPDVASLFVPQVAPSCAPAWRENAAGTTGHLQAFASGETGSVTLEVGDDHGRGQRQELPQQMGGDLGASDENAGEIHLSLRAAPFAAFLTPYAVMENGEKELLAQPTKLLSNTAAKDVDDPTGTTDGRPFESKDMGWPNLKLPDQVSARPANLPGATLTTDTALHLDRVDLSRASSVKVRIANSTDDIAASSRPTLPANSSQESGKADRPAVSQVFTNSPDPAVPGEAIAAATQSARTGAESDDETPQQQLNAKSGPERTNKDTVESSGGNQFLMADVRTQDSSNTAPAKEGAGSAASADRPRFPPELDAQNSIWNPDKAVNAGQNADQIVRGDLRLAIKTERLGNVELHARIAGDQLGAAITVNKKDAHAALATELPALHQALSEKRFRVEGLSLLQGTLDASARDAQESFAQRAATPPKVRWGQGNVECEVALVSTEKQEGYAIFDSSGRLSVHV